MILETPLLIVDPSLWTNQFVLGKDYLGAFICDNVSISTLSMKSKPPSKGLLRPTIRVVLVNRPGQDKLVSLTFEVLQSDAPIGSPASVLNIDLEERQAFHRDVTLALPVAQLVPGTTPTLRITVGVKDN